jgi:predicted methyltransferase
MKNNVLYFLSPASRTEINSLRGQATPISARISLDLGLTSQNIRLLDRNTIEVNGGRLLIPENILNITDDRTIFVYRDEEWQKWQRFDEKSGKYYKMVHVAPGVPPTVEISGIKMHITKDSDPERDTRQKLDTLNILGKKVLDTCMGLGYTAIAAARELETEQIFCCERDMNIFSLCRENPWSRILFENPKIQLLLTPVQFFVKQLSDNYIDTVIHDPPRFSLAPELYTKAFYQEVYRIMRNGGGFYHYTGDPYRQSRRQSLAEKTRMLLSEIGFRKIRLTYAGVVAVK